MWGVSEDEVLKAGVVKYGTNAWKQVAASMFSDRRSWRDCKERFELITEKIWTMEDDDRLVREVKKFHCNVHWATIALVMKRPLESCRNRYFSPTKIQTPAFKKALGSNSIKIRKSARRTHVASGMKKKLEL
ncbi:hypothetical protein Bca4012_073834 [Brassica carinata]|uniref:Myb-like domain-containing protein n=2 Tax=Brassica TaxID=3705 RepID=A0ABQ7F325_BRACR|nr:hypothetical protein DY000_02050163 [Brassica cretica]KAG2271586.1 hypothetical protein Bca52824_066141 [Brassica carinata]